MIPPTKFVTLLNKKFLSDLIGQLITEYSISTGSSQGDIAGSNLLKVDIKTEKKEILRIIIKTPYDNPSQLTYTTKFRIFEIENRFYSYLLPQLQQLLLNGRKRKDGQTISQLPIPHYFPGHKEYLVLEDVRPLGFKMVDKSKSLTYPQVSIVIKNLAKFHATSYTFLRHEGQRFFRVEENKLFLGIITQLKDSLEVRTKYSSAFDQMYATACEILAEKNSTLGHKIKKLSTIAQTLMIHIYSKTDDVKYFPIIGHGDFCQNNLLFKYEEDGKTVQEVIFLDFQHSRRDSIFFDLLYFIFTSTSVQFRKDYLVTVLNEYYESFVETLNCLQCPIPMGFSRGWIIDEFYENLPNIFIYIAAAVGALKSPKPVMDQSDENLISFDDCLKEIVSSGSSFLLENSAATLNRFEAIASELNDMGVFDKF